MRTGIGKKFIVLAAAIGLILVCCTFTACYNPPKDPSHLIAQGYRCVTIDCNGGLIGKYGQRTVYVMPGALIPEPGSNDNFPAPKLDDAHDLAGWYIRYTDNGDTIEEPWQFSSKKMPDSDIVLYAKWVERLKFTVKFCPEGGEQDPEERVTYISHFETAEKKTITRPERQPAIEGQTFIDYYEDAAFTTKVTFPLLHSGTFEDNEIVVYARFIEGQYRIVASAGDLSGIGTYTNLYLLDHIDMKDTVWNMPENYAGIIKGNGFSFKNIKSGEEQLGSANKFGLFKALGAATFIDVKFVDCAYTVIFKNISNSTIAYAGLLAGSVSADAVFEDVYVSGSVRVVINLRSVSDRANGLRYDGVFGEVPEGLDVSGCTADINRYYMYAVTKMLSEAESADLIAAGYIQAVLDLDNGAAARTYYYCLPETVLLMPGELDILKTPVNFENGKMLTLEGYYRGEKTGDTITYFEEWDFSAEVNEPVEIYAKWNRS